MKKLGYFLSLAGHTLLLLAILNARFTVTIHREPARVVAVRVMEPPPPYFSGGITPRTSAGGGSPATGGTNGAADSTQGRATNAAAGPPSSRGGRPFPEAGSFSLQSRPTGTFRLAAVGKSPDPWAVPVGPAPSSRLRGYRPETFRPTSGGESAGGGVFLVPFDIREKAVAVWTETALSRIERNWSIPASARLSFSGRVQVTLIVEKNGRQRALAVDDPTLPEALSRSALHAVQASLPLPPLPENVAGETFAFTLVFIYNG